MPAERGSVYLGMVAHKLQLSTWWRLMRRADIRLLPEGLSSVITMEGLRCFRFVGLLVLVIELVIFSAFGYTIKATFGLHYPPSGRTSTYYLRHSSSCLFPSLATMQGSRKNCSTPHRKISFRLQSGFCLACYPCSQILKSQPLRLRVRIRVQA
jgi:hypothetical protein